MTETNGNGAHGGFDSLYEFTRPEVRELDLGGMIGELAGVKVKCYVNRPGIREAFAEHQSSVIRTDYDREGNVSHSEVETAGGRDSYDRHRRAVSLLFDQPFDKVKTLDDDKLLWLFNEGFRLLNEYNDELKNSNGSLLVTSPLVASEP